MLDKIGELASVVSVPRVSRSDNVSLKNVIKKNKHLGNNTSKILSEVVPVKVTGNISPDTNSISRNANNPDNNLKGLNVFSNHRDIM